MENIDLKLPELDCGICGFRTCKDFSLGVKKDPLLAERCIHLSEQHPISSGEKKEELKSAAAPQPVPSLVDSLGREFDFILEHFPEDPGPREIIIPHNPMLTRELEIQKEDILIGRPLGMSCGCPVTHCGIVSDVDRKTGVIVWCVTGPLNPRQKGFKDLGYYIAEGYEGLITSARSEIKIGIRYFFQPRMCMLQWRHSGMVNFLNRTPQGLQVRLEGLWIG